MSIVSRAVAIADKVTKNLKMQGYVTHYSYSSDGGKGDPVETITKPYAVIDKKQRLIRTFSGEMAVSNTQVMILKPGVTVKEGDRIILKDGTGGPVIGIGGFVDGESNAQAFTEAYLG